jgi:deoxyadenosine/deoxycytidine kinase
VSIKLSDVAALIEANEVPRYIAIEGPIGVGKTTLARKLGFTFNYQMLLEQAEQNPFLERFYGNRREAALATQLFFLFQRAQQIQDMRQGDIFEPVRVADFLIEKDRMFARVNLDDDEFELYQKVYRQLTLEIPAPDLVVYLQAPAEVLMSRIKQRGLDAERRIERAYLEELNNAYSQFFLDYDAAPLLIVNAAEIDLAGNDRHYVNLVEYLLTIKRGRHYFNPSIFQ